jgi:hypothetical protein
VSKCQNVSEVFAIQTHWLHDATDDYLKEMGKLMEVNSKVIGGVLATVGQVEDRTSAKMRSSLVKA